MSEVYLLDTNAYFNFLRYATLINNPKSIDESIAKIKRGTNYISVISKIEIISVIGKYARGKSSGIQKCNCTISENGERCPHYQYTARQGRWNKKKIKGRLKLVNETLEGTSPVLNVSILPLSYEVISEAQDIIKHALIHNFGSLDALIAATAKTQNENDKNVKLHIVTSDKGLKACLEKCSLHFWDAFSLKIPPQ